MAANNSPAATGDIRSWLDQALESQRGIKVKLGSRDDCIRNRQRIYSFRIYDRAQNKKVYPEGNPMHGRSPYDGLTVVIDENNDMRIEKMLDSGNFTVEEL